jgi:hypothetical protein
MIALLDRKSEDPEPDFIINRILHYVNTDKPWFYLRIMPRFYRNFLREGGRWGPSMNAAKSRPHPAG